MTEIFRGTESPQPGSYPQVESFFESLKPIATAVGLALVAAHKFAEWELGRAERGHRRMELRNAYRLRHQWKRSDIPKLQTLDLNRYAAARIERLEGTGRPIVEGHRPLGQAFIEKLVAIKTVDSPASTREDRRKALRLTPWWTHTVEAIYRGEHALARERNTKGASAHAEERVGRALGMSASTVHNTCGVIRALRRRDEYGADFPTMTLDDYEVWMNTGENPKLDIWFSGEQETGRSLG